MSAVTVSTVPGSGILANKLDDNALTAAIAYAQHQAYLEEHSRIARQQRLQRLRYIPPLPPPMTEPLPVTPVKAKNSIKSAASSIRSFGKEKPKKLRFRFWKGWKRKIAPVITRQGPRQSLSAVPISPQALSSSHEAATRKKTAPAIRIPPPIPPRPEVSLTESFIPDAFELAAVSTPDVVEMGPPPAWELDAVTTERVLEVDVMLAPATPSPHDTLTESLEGDRKGKSDTTSPPREVHTRPGTAIGWTNGDEQPPQARKGSVSTLERPRSVGNFSHVKYSTHPSIDKTLLSSCPARKQIVTVAPTMEANEANDGDSLYAESVTARNQATTLSKQSSARSLHTAQSAFELVTPPRTIPESAEEQQSSTDSTTVRMHIPTSRYHPALHFHEVTKYGQERFDAIPTPTYDPIPHLGAGDTIDTLRADTMKEVLSTMREADHDNKTLGLHPALRPRASSQGTLISKPSTRSLHERKASGPATFPSKPPPSGLRSLAVAIHFKSKDKDPLKSERHRAEKEEKLREAARKQAVDKASTKKLDKELERYRAEVVARRKMQSKASGEYER